MLTLCFTIIGAFAQAATLGDVLKEHGLTLDGAPRAFTVTTDQKVKGERKNLRTLEAKSASGERVQIKIIQPMEAQAAEAAASAERATIKKLYAAPQTPYMGDIAQALGGCPASLGPLESELKIAELPGHLVVGAATASDAFGACTTAESKNKGGLVTFYDPVRKALWTWRVFAPWNPRQTPLSTEWLTAILKQVQPSDHDLTAR